jgi:hypothetical protein
MNVELTEDEIQVLLTSLAYSRQRLLDARDTPAKVREDQLSRLDAASAKLRSVR